MSNFKTLLHHLSRTEPLISNILMQISKISQPSLDTPASLSCSSNGFELYYNLEILKEYNLDDQITILMHEVLHMVNDHHLRGINKKLNLWNLSTDLAVNSMLRYRISSFLQDELFLPEHFNLSDNKSADWYYTALQDYPLEIPSISHSGWEVGVSGKNLLQQASFITGISHEIIIENDKSQPHLNWKHILNKIIKSNLADSKSYSYKRISRRFRRPPGKKRNYASPTILVVLDTSESISMATHQSFAQEIYDLSLHNSSNLLIVECDESVHRVYFFKPGQTIHEVHGGHGTAYVPAFKEIEKLTKQHNIGCIIYFTDGFSNDGALLKKPQIPVVWVYPNKQCPKAVIWGFHLYVGA